MTDLSHLHALELRLSHEETRLANARNANERKFREVQVMLAKKEIAGERKFLGLGEEPPAMSLDEIMRELEG